jgi:hypothetical protein
LNLIATQDAKPANENASYKKLYYATMAKCLALWNKASRSVQAAETVHDELNMSLIVPNDTRWNAHYDAVDKIRHMVVTVETKFRVVCEKLRVTPFRMNEVAFLTSCRLRRTASWASYFQL